MEWYCIWIVFEWKLTDEIHQIWFRQIDFFMKLAWHYLSERMIVLGQRKYFTTNALIIPTKRAGIFQHFYVWNILFKHDERTNVYDSQCTQTIDTWTTFKNISTLFNQFPIEKRKRAAMMTRNLILAIANDN